MVSNFQITFCRETVNLHVEFDQIMILAAVISSIDLLAVTPQVPSSSYPYIHNLVLGQGLFCDVTAVTLVFSTETFYI